MTHMLGWDIEVAPLALAPVFCVCNCDCVCSCVSYCGVYVATRGLSSSSSRKAHKKSNAKTISPKAFTKHSATARFHASHVVPNPTSTREFAILIPTPTDTFESFACSPRQLQSIQSNELSHTVLHAIWRQMHTACISAM